MVLVLTGVGGPTHRYRSNIEVPVGTWYRDGSRKQSGQKKPYSRGTAPEGRPKVDLVACSKNLEVDNLEVRTWPRAHNFCLVQESGSAYSDHDHDALLRKTRAQESRAGSKQRHGNIMSLISMMHLQSL